MPNIWLPREATKEAVYLNNLLKTAITDLRLDIQHEIPAIFEDNQGTIKLANNPEFHKRTKHIDIQYHYIRECITNHQIRLYYIPTKEQLADPLTKSIDKITLEAFRTFFLKNKNNTKG